MKALAFLSCLCSLSLAGSAQNFNLTFTATGAASQIDSIIATNLATGGQIVLPGNKTLTLNVISGTRYEMVEPWNTMVFPNPTSGKSTISFRLLQAGSVRLMVTNLAGQPVAETASFLEPGRHHCEISMKSPGIYLVSLSCQDGMKSIRIVCTGSDEQDNHIVFNGRDPSEKRFTSSGNLKSGQSLYTLQYRLGDVLHFRCRSGNLTTIKTDSPVGPVNYQIRFASCTDGSGRNYSIVEIGTQTWMAENLAYFPANSFISPSNSGSETVPHYYVYGYEGTDAAQALVLPNYLIYGLLYNWTAAGAACPAGWHLPSDDEWLILYHFSGGTYGGDLKEVGLAHWMAPNRGATDKVGFGAIPGGNRISLGGFGRLGQNAYFWTSTETNSSSAWYRYVYYDDSSLYRYSFSKKGGYSIRCVKN